MRHVVFLDDGDAAPGEQRASGFEFSLPHVEADVVDAQPGGAAWRVGFFPGPDAPNDEHPATNHELGLGCSFTLARIDHARAQDFAVEAHRLVVVCMEDVRVLVGEFHGGSSFRRAERARAR